MVWIAFFKKSSRFVQVIIRDSTITARNAEGETWKIPLSDPLGRSALPTENVTASDA